MFKPRKRKIYPLSKNEREEVQNFVEDQLRKRYIRPSKSPQTLKGCKRELHTGTNKLIMCQLPIAC